MAKLALCLTAVLMLIAGCSNGGSDSAQASELSADAAIDFGGADLYFVQIGAPNSVWRFDSGTREPASVTTGGGEDNFSIISLAPGKTSGLYGLVLSDVGLSLARIGQGQVEILIAEDGIDCIARGGQSEVRVMRDDAPGAFESTEGVAGSVLDVDPATAGVTALPYPARYLFCPSWSGDDTFTAYAGPRNPDGSFTVPLSVLANGVASTRLVPDCAFAPGDFSPDGRQLAVAASCAQGAVLESGVYLFDPADLELEPVLVRSGVTTAPRWSPDGAWLTYSWSGADRSEAEGDAQFVEAVNVAAGRYVRVAAPNATSPAWVSGGLGP